MARSGLRIRSRFVFRPHFHLATSTDSRLNETVGHRYLENNLANIVAKQVFQESSYQQIVVGGSNFGELLGAVTVFLTAQSIPTYVTPVFLACLVLSISSLVRPIPFIRLDALMLLIVWYIPYWYPAPHKSIEAWKVCCDGCSSTEFLTLWLRWLRHICQ